MNTAPAVRVRQALAALGLVACLFTATTATAQPGRTEPLARGVPTVELYTFEVGSLVFQKFGHAALCLMYPGERPERAPCFNYGITDYGDPGGLIWGFLRGKQKFWVAAERLGYMLRSYIDEDRTIWRQKLPLTDEQARQIEEKLWFDSREENKYYYYDHFYDNCSTRLRDIVDEAAGGVLARDTAGKNFPRTFREAGARGLAPMPYILGIGDFLVGRALSKTPTMWEAMFLPDQLRVQVEQSFGAVPEVVYQRKGPRLPWPTDAAPPASFWRSYTLLFAVLFALPLLVANWRRRFRRIALGWAMIPLVVWGLVIWGLVIISAVPSLRFNEAIFVLMPIDLIIPFLGPRKRRLYALGRVGVLLLSSILCAIGVFAAPLWVPILTAFLPLAIIGFDLPHMTPVPAKNAKSSTEKPLKTAKAK